MTKKLIEQGTLAGKASNGTVPIRIITEGKGSSGTYPRTLLETYKDVFADRPMHMDHPVDPDHPEDRSVLSMAARLGQVEYKEVDGIAGLYSEAVIRSEYREFIEQFGDLIGVSIYVAGEGKEVNGEYVVESFDGTDPYRSVDFVIAAGRGGRIERAMESARKIETSLGQPGVHSTTSVVADEKMKENLTMDEAAIKALVESALAEALKPVLEKIDSAVTLLEAAKAVPADEAKTLDAVKEIDEALAESELPKGARARVIESVLKGGAAVADAVKVEKDLKDAILKEYGVEQGRVRVTENDKPTETTYTTGVWNR